MPKKKPGRPKIYPTISRSVKEAEYWTEPLHAIEAERFSDEALEIRGWCLMAQAFDTSELLPGTGEYYKLAIGKAVAEALLKNNSELFDELSQLASDREPSVPEQILACLQDDSVAERTLDEIWVTLPKEIRQQGSFDTLKRTLIAAGINYRKQNRAKKRK